MPALFMGNRLWEVVLVRLHLGQTKLTHEYYISRGSRLMCLRCSIQLTVKHILVDCSRFAATCTGRFHSLFAAQLLHRLSSLFSNFGLLIPFFHSSPLYCPLSLYPPPFLSFSNPIFYFLYFLFPHSYPLS